jgi:hypothetical protein
MSIPSPMVTAVHRSVHQPPPTSALVRLVRAPVERPQFGG